MRYLFIVFLLSQAAWARDTSVYVYNITRDQVEYSHNRDQVRAIASVTKVMTAMVVLDHNPDLQETLPLSRRVASNLPAQRYTRRALLTAMLVRSDNAAAETLAEHAPGGRHIFIQDMNRHAHQFMMMHTQFEDPTGLGAHNLSTVTDVSIMMSRAMNYELIRETSTRKQAQFETQHKKKRQIITLPNTNQPLLTSFDNILLSKTGLTNAAGWCVSMVVEQDLQRYVVVILGARSRDARLNTARTRIQDLGHTQNIASQISFL